MRLIWLAIGKVLNTFERTYALCIRKYHLVRFAKCGSGVWIERNCWFTHPTISIGDDVYIGRGACFQSAHGEIHIGSHVMFGPGVHIHGGNHNTNAVGSLMKSAPPKRKGEDGMVRICDDVWIGARAIILKGVTVGEGSVIGAGAVIHQDVPPYSVVVGALPRRIWPRFDTETLAAHRVSLCGLPVE